MNKLLSFAALLLVFAGSAWAYDFSAVAPTGQTLYYNINGSNVEVTYPDTATNNPWGSYTMPAGALSIPSTVTFDNQTYSVTSIGDFAFRYCGELTSITIPNSVTSIGGSAFHNCSGLTSATIPNSVTIIGDYAFAGCSALTSITLPNSVASIGEWAFGFVRNVVYDGSATGSPWGALSVNGYVDGYLVYSDATRTTLLGCSTAAAGTIAIPNSVATIGNGAFEGCSALTGVTIPNSVTSIGERAFSYCSSLTSVTIPNFVTSIENYAFYNCGALAIVTIGDSVSTIGNYVFYNCRDLTEITSLASVAPILGNDAFTGVSSTIPVNIPCGSTSVASYYSRWSYFSYFIECGAGIDDAEVATYAVRAVAGGVVIEGAAGREVRLYDIQGRLLRQLRADRDPLQLEVSHGGVYLLQVDSHAAQKVVVF